MSHRRKRKVNLVKNSPFPVPIQSLTGVSAKPSYWYYYTAELKGEYAAVVHSGDIKYLHTMGFFGKGMLSRGQTEIQKSFPNIHIPANNGDTNVIKVMRRRMYLRHKQWSSMSLDKEQTDPADLQEFDSDVEYYPQQEPPEFSCQCPVREHGADNVDVESCDRHETDNNEENDHNPKHEDSNVIRESEVAWSDTEADENFWDEPELNRENEKKSNIDDWERMEADHDFWGTEEKNADMISDSIKMQDSVSRDNAEHETSETSQNKLKSDFEDRDKDNLLISQTAIDKRKLDSSDGADSEVRTSDKRSNSIAVNNSCESVHLSSKKLKLENKDISDKLNQNHSYHSEDVTIRTRDSVELPELNHIEDNNRECLNVIDSNKLVQMSDTSHEDAKSTSSKTEKLEEFFQTSSKSKNVDICKVKTDLKPNKDNTESQENAEFNTEQSNCDFVESCIDSDRDLNSTERGAYEIKIGAYDTGMIINDTNKDTSDIEKGTYKDKDSGLDGTEIDNIDKEGSLNNTETDNTDKDMCIDDTERDDRPPLHPLCVDEDSDGEFLVIDDSDCDDTVANIPIIKKTLWEPVRKKDSYPYTEPLLLSLEETFFLSYGLGCLTVKDEKQCVLTMCDMWRTFCHRRRRFLPSYVAYHYFRSKGWVPKSGLVFGVDFILYREGPPFYHGSYSVIVKTVYEGDYSPVEKYKERQLTWTSFACINRVTEHVAKTLLFCYVIMPKDLSRHDLETPKCLNRFKIRLQLVNRWVSSQERGDKAKTTEIP